MKKNTVRQTVQSLWKKFLNDERGQSTTEYILILAVVVMIAAKFKGFIVGKVGNMTDKITGDIDDALSDQQ